LEPAVRLLLAAAVLLLAGCTLIGHQPAPQGWPSDDRVKVTVVKASLWETHLACGGSAVQFALGVWYTACAHVTLDETCSNATCVITTSTDDPATMEHECEHCRGRDHFGSTAFADYFKRCMNSRGL
jgi:hypothetical protein